MENYHTRLLNFKLLLTLLFVCLVNISFSQGLRFLIPDGVVSQYGGSIGMVSGGVTYDVFKNKRGNLDFAYGHVPEAKGGPLDLLAAKFSYRPIGIKVRDYATIYPINPGTFVSYTSGDKFAKWSTTQYPKGYYWWSKSTRIHLSASTEVRLNMQRLLPKSRLKDIGIYSEANTNDLYAVSWFKNRDGLSVRDVIRFGYGVRVYF